MSRCASTILYILVVLCVVLAQPVVAPPPTPAPSPPAPTPSPPPAPTPPTPAAPPQADPCEPLTGCKPCLALVDHNGDHLCYYCRKSQQCILRNETSNPTPPPPADKDLITAALKSGRLTEKRLREYSEYFKRDDDGLCPKSCKLLSNDEDQCAMTNCSALTTCGKCTKYSCNWCTATKTCQDPCGSQMSGLCPEGCATNLPESCPVETCSSFLNCTSCTAAGNSTCGWCKDTGKCVDTTFSRLFPCSADKCKTFSVGTCEAQCNSNPSCTSCLQDKSDCGWCAGSQRGGKQSSYCGKVFEHASDCQVKFDKDLPCPNCSTRAKNCTTCTAVSYCGWCNNSLTVGASTCVQGDMKGAYEPLDCPIASNHTWVGKCIDMTPLNPLEPQPPAPQPPTPTPPSPPVHPPQPIEPLSPPETYPAEIGIGVGVGVAIIIMGGLIWWQVQKRARYRYRAIG